MKNTLMARCGSFWSRIPCGQIDSEQVSEIKALIMSTAKPHVNKETGVYTSPRQQGAGVVVQLQPFQQTCM